ncbi:MAG: 4-hydroxythreonine-4-phosphate dehydrogenase PdxA [Acidobacteria bacterium]|nr:4-hydroxythreonine-4-phosphate dehydrogenase PdxA [Acidobacteriota bacterium]
MGDAAGIGPEIVLKALADRSIFGICRPLVIGDARVLRDNAEALGLFPALDVAAGDIHGSFGNVPVCDLANIGLPFEIGKDGAVTGRASAEYIEKAVELWSRGKVDAIATAPISKAAIQLGGYDFPGHTEFLAFLTDTKRFAMSFFADKLRVVLLSTHVSLRDAIGLVKREKLVDLIGFTDLEIAGLLKKKPRIAVAGLNPHASEGGMFGQEEGLEITPAIDECRKLGIDVHGPFPPDTIFLRAYRGEFDVVVACYHDQATIPVKCLSFGASVNVTLGLPLIRTSVDHGTAYDIAGLGRADESSLVAAVKLAATLAEIRKTDKLC